MGKTREGKIPLRETLRPMCARTYALAKGETTGLRSKNGAGERTVLGAGTNVRRKFADPKVKDKGAD